MFVKQKEVRLDTITRWLYDFKVFSYNLKVDNSLIHFDMLNACSYTFSIKYFVLVPDFFRCFPASHHLNTLQLV